MKRVSIILIVLVVLSVVAFFVLNNPLGRLVKIAIEGIGSDLIKAEVNVNSVNISTSDGRGKLIGLKLGNPKGFNADHAFKADTIELVIEPLSLANDLVILHKVFIDSPQINIEQGKNGNNFNVIQRNIESHLGMKNESKENTKRLIIDSFIIRDAKVNYNNTIDLAIPDIELQNIGKKTGGSTPTQVTRTIIIELNSRIALAIAETATNGSMGGVAIGAGIAVKNLLGK